MFRSAILIALLVAATHGAASALECVNYPDYLRTTGIYEIEGVDMIVHGDLAFVRSSSGLRILELADPLNPVDLGLLEIDGSLTSLYGDTAFVTRSAGYDVVDISDVTNPVTQLSVRTPFSAGGYRIHPVGQYHVLHRQGGQILVVDPARYWIDNVVANHQFSGFYLWTYLRGSTLYAQDFGGGVQMLDVSDPLDIQLGPFLESDGEVQDVFVQGDRMFVANMRDLSNGEVLVFDISLPESPVLLTTLQGLPTEFGTPSVRAVTADGDDVWVMQYSSRCLQFDISNLLNPVLVGGFQSASRDLEAIATRRGAAYLLPGMEIVDGRSRAAVAADEEFAPAVGGALDVVVRENLAYVTGSLDGGLEIFDLQAQGGPVAVGGVTFSNQAHRVELLGNHAVVAAGLNQVEIIDVSDPANPQIVPTPRIAPGGNAHDVSLQGNMAYVAAGPLVAMDLTDPTAPVVSDPFDTPGTAFGLFAADNYIYVGDQDAGLTIVDFNETPSVVGSLDLGTDCRYVFVEDGIAYIAANPEGPMGILHLVDVSVPTQPALLSSLEFPGWGRDVVVVDEIAYFASFHGGLHVIDVSDPVQPRKLGRSDGHALSLNVQGDKVYVAGGNTVRVVPIQCSTIVPVAVDGLRAIAGPEGVRIRWEVVAGGEPMEFRVWRSASEDHWGRLIGTISGGWEGTQEFLDPGVDLGQSWLYRVEVRFGQGDSLVLGPVQWTPMSGGLGTIVARGAFPNPFDETTTVAFRLERPGRVWLSVHDVRGRRLRSLTLGSLQAGPHQWSWNARGDDGQRVAAGVYFVRLSTELEETTVRLERLR